MADNSNTSSSDLAKQLKRELKLSASPSELLHVVLNVHVSLVHSLKLMIIEKSLISLQTMSALDEGEKRVDKSSTSHQGSKSSTSPKKSITPIMRNKKKKALCLRLVQLNLECVKSVVEKDKLSISTSSKKSLISEKDKKNKSSEEEKLTKSSRQKRKGLMISVTLMTSDF